MTLPADCFPYRYFKSLSGLDLSALSMIERRIPEGTELVRFVPPEDPYLWRFQVLGIGGHTWAQGQGDTAEEAAAHLDEEITAFRKLPHAAKHHRAPQED